jgi:hypothetical protein
MTFVEMIYAICIVVNGSIEFTDELKRGKLLLSKLKSFFKGVGSGALV